MSPKVVCQQSFFTLAVHLSAKADFLFCYLVLFVRPGWHGLLTHSAYFFDQAHFGCVGFFQIACGVFYDGKQRGYSVFDLRICIEAPHDGFVARYLRFCHGLAFRWDKFLV